MVRSVWPCVLTFLNVETEFPLRDWSSVALLLDTRGWEKGKMEDEGNMHQKMKWKIRRTFGKGERKETDSERLRKNISRSGMMTEAEEGGRKQLNLIAKSFNMRLKRRTQERRRGWISSEENDDLDKVTLREEWITSRRVRLRNRGDRERMLKAWDSWQGWCSRMM